MKTKRSLMYFIVVFMGFICYTAMSSAEDLSNKHIDRFVIENEPMRGAVANLRRIHKVRVCFEEREYDEKDAVIITTDGIEKCVAPDEKKLSVDLRNASVQDVLNELVKNDPTYFWEVSPTGVINMLPCSSDTNKYGKSILNWMVTSLNIENEELIAIGGATHPFGKMLLEHNIASRWMIVGINDLPNRIISVALTNATIRECLNAIVKAAGDDCYWTVYGYSFTGETMIGTRRVRTLEFGRYYPQFETTIN